MSESPLKTTGTDPLNAEDLALLDKFGKLIQRETTGSEEWDPILHSAGASIVRLCLQLTAAEAAPKFYFEGMSQESWKAHHKAGWARAAELEQSLTASEKDAARMQYLEDEAVHVEVQQSALADTGDYSVCMVVIERHMDERNNRVLGTGSTWREAIDNAMGDGNG